MKKTYMIPASLVQDLELENMIADSLGGFSLMGFGNDVGEGEEITASTRGIEDNDADIW